MSALVIYEILKMFVNTFTDDDKYSRRNLQNLRQEVQTLLSEKVKNFCGFFIAVLKCAWNVEHFEKKNKYPRLNISKIIESERGGYLNV